jgi:hypothetical protein
MKHSEHIIDELEKLGATKIAPHDYLLFKKYFLKDGSFTYGNSWSFINQASRNLRYKLLTGNMLLTIGFWKNHFVIIRPLGQITDDFIDIIKKLKSISKKPVFLKKIHPNQVSKIVNLDRRFIINSRESHYPWDNNSFADDDTFPELILDIKLNLNISLFPNQWYENFKKKAGYKANKKKVIKRYKDFRRRINNYKKRDNTVFDIKEYCIDDKEKVIIFFESYFGSDKKENVTAHTSIINSIILHRESFFNFVIYMENKIVGFVSFERINDITCGRYVRLIDSCCIGFSEFIDLELLRILYKCKYHFLNIGGSETFKLHQYKIKNNPVNKINMKMLIWK